MPGTDWPNTLFEGTFGASGDTVFSMSDWPMYCRRESQPLVFLLMRIPRDALSKDGQHALRSHVKSESFSA